MDRDMMNYGVQRAHEPRYAPRPEAYRSPYPVSTGDERTWSALAHLSTFLNLVTGFLGPVAALAIWLAFRGRSPVVASNALRSTVYQMAWLAAVVVGWTVTTALMAVLIGFLLVPVMALVTVAPFVQASVEAYRAYRGAGRRYV